MSYPPYAGVDTYGQPNVDAWWTRGSTAQNKAYLVAPSPVGEYPGAPDITHRSMSPTPTSIQTGRRCTGSLTFMPLTNARLRRAAPPGGCLPGYRGTTTVSPYFNRVRVAPEQLWVYLPVPGPAQCQPNAHRPGRHGHRQRKPADLPGDRAFPGRPEVPDLGPG